VWIGGVSLGPHSTSRGPGLAQINAKLGAADEARGASVPKPVIMSLHEYNGVKPKLGDRVFIAEGARVIGDVEIGDDSSVWFNTVIRGDVNWIRIGRHTNIQDGCVCHVQRDEYPCVVGDYVTVGHGVILHGCRVESHCLIGMRSTLLNDVRVGSESIIAAGALVTEGTVIPPRSLVMGMPAKVKREVTEREIERIYGSARHYSKFKDTYLGK
jgi:carbonic anhydrase/acetyltransferase-like protein (isoleucine patch superfamily)